MIEGKGRAPPDPCEYSFVDATVDSYRTAACAEREPVLLDPGVRIDGHAVSLRCDRRPSAAVEDRRSS